MISEEIVSKLRERYSNIDPFIFHRSLERAKSDSDLFDILDSFPAKYPVVWCELSRRWVHTNDIYQIEDFLGEI